jgi:hypothetical protein
MKELNSNSFDRCNLKHNSSPRTGRTIIFTYLLSLVAGFTQTKRDTVVSFCSILLIMSFLITVEYVVHLFVYQLHPTWPKELAGKIHANIWNKSQKVDVTANRDERETIDANGIPSLSNASCVASLMEKGDRSQVKVAISRVGKKRQKVWKTKLFLEY